MPTGGAAECVCADGVLLAGDAGGLASCFGSGIASAVVSGELAGRAVGAALAATSYKSLRFYGAEVRRRLPTWRVGGDGFEGLIDRMEAVAEWRGD